MRRSSRRLAHWGASVLSKDLNDGQDYDGVRVQTRPDSRKRLIQPPAEDQPAFSVLGSTKEEEEMEKASVSDVQVDRRRDRCPRRCCTVAWAVPVGEGGERYYKEQTQQEMKRLVVLRAKKVKKNRSAESRATRTEEGDLDPARPLHRHLGRHRFTGAASPAARQEIRSPRARAMKPVTAARRFDLRAVRPMRAARDDRKRPVR